MCAGDDSHMNDHKSFFFIFDSCLNILFIYFLSQDFI